MSFAEKVKSTTPYMVYAYEIEKENGKDRYVEIWIDEDMITQATVVNEEDELLHPDV